MSRIQELSACLLVAGLIGACAGETGPAASPDGTVASYDFGYTPPPPPPPPVQDGGIAPTYDTGSSIQSGNASCTEIVACFYVNDCQDDACDQGCVAQGSAAAQQQYQAMDQCEDGAFGTTCPTCNEQQFDMSCATCLNSTCGQQYTACGMTSTCSQGYNCADNCGESDTQCIEGCLSKLSILGVAQSLALETCWQNAVQGACASSCTDQESDQCYTCSDGQCASEIQACGLVP